MIITPQFLGELDQFTYSGMQSLLDKQLHSSRFRVPKPARLNMNNFPPGLVRQGRNFAHDYAIGLLYQIFLVDEASCFQIRDAFGILRFWSLSLPEKASALRWSLFWRFAGVRPVSERFFRSLRDLTCHLRGDLHNINPLLDRPPEPVLKPLILEIT